MQNYFEMLSRLIQSLWLQVVYIYVIQKIIMLIPFQEII
jgi:hypothetical protein